MNSRKTYSALALALALFFLSCNKSGPRTIIGKLPGNLVAPQDAIVKFESANENIVSDGVLSFAQSQGVEFSDQEEEEISSWFKNTVFSNKHSNPLIKEWDINDEDICMGKRIISTSPTQKVDTANIQICNTVFSQDVSAGNWWELKSKNYSIFLQYSFGFLEYEKHVGYYEVIGKGEELEYLEATVLNKYKAQVSLHLSLYDKKSNTEFNKLILSDNGYLYTQAANLQNENNQ